LGVAVLGEIFDELHDFHAEAISLVPKSKFRMFGFDLIDEVKEHCVHFVPKVVELLGTEVGIVINHRLYFFPPHLRAALMEERALVLAIEAGLTDQPWFPAVGIGAHCETGSAVDALWASIFILSH
jgi:hypothetical protein